MKNNLGKKVRELARTNVIYDIDCQKGDYEHLPQRNRSYSGLTTCTMSRRLTFHLQDGAVQRHHLAVHKVKITRKEIEAGTKIRYQENDTNRLEVLESLIIHFEDPEINKQDTGKQRVLKLYGAARVPVERSWVGWWEEGDNSERLSWLLWNVRVCLSGLPKNEHFLFCFVKKKP